MLCNICVKFELSNQSFRTKNNCEQVNHYLISLFSLYYLVLEFANAEDLHPHSVQ